MSNNLSAETVALVKATVPALLEHGTEITAAMYRRLFENSEIAELFNSANRDNGAQVRALAFAVVAYAQHIDDLGALSSAVERIAQKHVAYSVKALHYPHVATALLGAISEVLGDAATPQILEAWGEAYWFLANIFVAREGQIRTENDEKAGSWSGWRRFIIAERYKESEDIFSLILKPEDGGRVIRHRPGQYLTVRLDVAGQSDLRRNYSISSGPNDDYYRLTVKRRSSQGASAFLHDHIPLGGVIECTAPAGDFVVDDSTGRPIVLLSGGVGQTPLVSMLESLTHSQSPAAIWYVHGTKNGSTHALKEIVQNLAKAQGNTRITTFYETTSPGDGAEAGFVTVDWLRKNTPFENADFYVCGPRPFMRLLVHGLLAAGVPASHVHYEFFEPTDEVLA